MNTSLSKLQIAMQKKKWRVVIWLSFSADKKTLKFVFY